MYIIIKTRDTALWEKIYKYIVYYKLVRRSENILNQK
jgi:hypothetical protein